MCQFFSGILTREGRVFFCEDDSHETILARLGWPDDRPLETRGWVRVECEHPHEVVCVDETSVPAWYEEDRPRYEGMVMDVALRLTQSRSVYYEALVPACRAYDNAIAQARRAYGDTLRTMTEYVADKEAQ